MSRNPLRRLILAVTLLALLAPGLAEARSRKPMNDTQASFAAERISERGFFSFFWDLLAAWTGSTAQAKNGGMLDPFGQTPPPGSGTGTGTSGSGTTSGTTTETGTGDGGDNGGMLDPHG
jgi:hypothetical protein